MNQPNTDKIPRKFRILIAPLDWGLGHATRCIPIIRSFLQKDVDMWLAGEGAQAQLLHTEFPSLPILDLQGYQIKYAKTKRGLLWKIFRQLPKMKKAIARENKWLQQQIDTYHFDLVISDNRYGLHHLIVPCIFITHQLTIQSPAGKWTEKILQKINYRYINRFTTCWIPDVAGQENLAGVLSHPTHRPKIPSQYIGWLSRLKKETNTTTTHHLCVILSGPEPQRSILEQKMLQEISQYNGTATIVRGLPATASIIPSTNMIKVYNHLPAAELEKEMQKAMYIIGRSGYSTIMDIIALGKKAILLPTPGQTEQEYLATYLKKKNIAFTCSSKSFSLTNVLQAAESFPYQIPAMSSANLLTAAIEELLHQLRVVKK